LAVAAAAAGLAAAAAAVSDASSALASPSLGMGDRTVFGNGAEVDLVSGGDGWRSESDKTVSGRLLSGRMFAAREDKPLDTRSPAWPAVSAAVSVACTAAVCGALLCGRIAPSREHSPLETRGTAPFLAALSAALSAAASITPETMDATSLVTRSTASGERVHGCVFAAPGERTGAGRACRPPIGIVVFSHGGTDDLRCVHHQDNASAHRRGCVDKAAAVREAQLAWSSFPNAHLCSLLLHERIF
jgi:hypothetical protein